MSLDIKLVCLRFYRGASREGERGEERERERRNGRGLFGGGGGGRGKRIVITRRGGTRRSKGIELRMKAKRKAN